MKNTFNTAVVNTLWQIVASKRLESDDPRTEKIIEMVNSQVEGVSLWNFFPNIRKQFPPNFLKQDRDALQIKSMMKELIAEHLQDIDYENPRDFIDIYLSEMKMGNNKYFNENQLVVTCIDFFIAGGETTSTTLLWAVMYMALYPKIQQNCQSEILEQVGSRSPSINDIPNLPYVMATLMEIQRISIVAPGSLPHILTKDLTFENYHFKKGTVFISNITKFLMNPEIFHNAKSFNPNRFLDKSGKLVKFDQFVPFGLGKRVCMGESLAKNELFLFFVRMLQKVSFEQTVNKPDVNNKTYGITTLPKPFEVKVVAK